MINISQPIIPAVIEWRDGLPYSPAFGDVYFSKENGIAETRHVFLDGNDLAQRFRDRRRFTIGETGFGTGLNFLCTYRLWREQAAAEARLTYFSIEKYPVGRDDLRRAHTLWPELREEAAWLDAAYPAATPGYHLRHLPHGVTLILAYGDIAEMLAELHGKCDAWFLDGFSPARNPAMWREDLWQRLADCTAPGGTLASFTAAGEVRRGLSAAGFEVRRGEGYGHKRHMTRACLPGEERDPVSPRRVAVLGAGIAGASAARALAERGVAVDMFEQADSAANGASGNPAAILFPLLQKEWTPQARFYLSAYQYALHRLKALPEMRRGLVGMIQLPKKQRGRRDAEGLQAIPAKLGLPVEIALAVDAAQASKLAGVQLPMGGLFFEESGWLDLKALTLALLDHPLIRTHVSSDVDCVEKSDQAWKIIAGDQSFPSDTLIMANGFGINDFASSLVRIQRVGGQLSQMLSNEQTSVQRKVICFGGYLLPATGKGHWLGATYERERTSLDVISESHQENLAKLQDALPALASSLRAIEQGVSDDIKGWAGIRAVSPDRLPLIGALDDGAFATLAHGSRGSVSAGLAGELLSAMICGELWPVERSVAERLAPGRFAKPPGRSRRHGKNTASRLDFERGDDT